MTHASLPLQPAAVHDQSVVVTLADIAFADGCLELLANAVLIARVEKTNAEDEVKSLAVGRRDGDLRGIFEDVDRDLLGDSEDMLVIARRKTAHYAEVPRSGARDVVAAGPPVKGGFVVGHWRKPGVDRRAREIAQRFIDLGPQFVVIVAGPREEARVTRRAI